MRRTRHRKLACVLAAVSCGAVGITWAGSAGQASGSIVVEGETATLGYVTVTPEFDSMVAVTLSDAELPAPCRAGDIQNVAAEHGISAVYLVVDTGEDLQVASGFQTLYHPRLDSGFESFGDDEGISVTRAQDGTIEGHIEHTVTNWEGTEFTIEAGFSFNPEQPSSPPAPRVIQGADSKPAQAFKTMVDAWMAGDFEGVKKQTAADFRARMDETDPKEAAEMMAEFADFLFPHSIKITDVTVEGDQAVVSAVGESPACMGVEHSTGTIDLIREGGNWKVAGARFEDES